MKLNTKILNLAGSPVKLSYPSEEMLEALPKKPSGLPDKSCLPEDTFRNVLLNCLSSYMVRDRREVFLVSGIGQMVTGEAEDLELSDKEKTFLIKVLYDQTVQMNDEKPSGIYMSWITSQLLLALGENINNISN